VIHTVTTNKKGSSSHSEKILVGSKRGRSSVKISTM
jgi:hypothetical protein